MNKRLGKIKISEELVRANTLDLIPLMSKFVPIHIEFLPHYRTYVYTGVCADFDELKEGEDIPVYTASVKNDNGKISVEFKNTIGVRPTTEPPKPIPS